MYLLGSVHRVLKTIIITLICLYNECWWYGRLLMFRVISVVIIIRERISARVPTYYLTRVLAFCIIYRTRLLITIRHYGSIKKLFLFLFIFQSNKWNVVLAIGRVDVSDNTIFLLNINSRISQSKLVFSHAQHSVTT